MLGHRQGAACSHGSDDSSGAGRCELCIPFVRESIHIPGLAAGRLPSPLTGLFCDSQPDLQVMGLWSPTAAPASSCRAWLCTAEAASCCQVTALQPAVKEPCSGTVEPGMRKNVAVARSMPQHQAPTQPALCRQASAKGHGPGRLHVC